MTEETKETEEKTLFDECKGRDVIKVLARKYHQLYLIPGEEGERLYPDVVNGGIEPFEMPYLKDLSHFRTTDGDSLCYEDTPAGKAFPVSADVRPYQSISVPGYSHLN